MNFTQPQLDIIESPLDTKVFLSGPAGTGKTTVGVERILYLIENRVSANQVLILLPQRSLAAPYLQSLQRSTFPPSGTPTILTFGGLSRRLIELFWPLVASEAGFMNPTSPPTFLTLESAQYFMALLVRPLIEEHGYFSSVTIKRNRLYSQLLDNLNKAAVHGFPYQEISRRLISAWIGDPGQRSIFDDAQDCANRFRTYCLENNLLDFSLQIEIFQHHLWTYTHVRDYFESQFSHLVFDNLEEDTPVAHQFIEDVLPKLKSALLIHDHDGGYRRFLGADPNSAKNLHQFCSTQENFSSSFITPTKLAAFADVLERTISKNKLIRSSHVDPRSFDLLSIHYFNYYPEMITWIGEEIAMLLECGNSPDQIAVLAPFLSDSLRFLLEDELGRRHINSFSHRPSRALREEPASQCLLTLAASTYSSWEIYPSRFQITQALLQAIEGLDLTRASILAEYGAALTGDKFRWKDFDALPNKIQQRVTYSIGNRYQSLVTWLNNAHGHPHVQLDYFFRRLFGEILSQPGFGFHNNIDRAQMAANLIESAKKFRLATGHVLDLSETELGKEYYSMVQEGIISAQYLSAWHQHPENAVFLSPSYTFLVNNYPVKYQFWLDAGSSGWYERIYQPLTHPYVLNQSWEFGQSWTDEDEYAISKSSLARLTKGLIRRCSDHVYVCLTEMDERGYEQKGLLLHALNHILH